MLAKPRVILITGCWLLAAGHWFLVTGSWLIADSYQLSASIFSLTFPQILFTIKFNKMTEQHDHQSPNTP